MKHDWFAIAIIFIAFAILGFTIYQFASQLESNQRRCLVGDDIVDCDTLAPDDE